jgi:hypothetical protein
VANHWVPGYLFANQTRARDVILAVANSFKRRGNMQLGCGGGSHSRLAETQCFPIAAECDGERRSRKNLSTD